MPGASTWRPPASMIRRIASARFMDAKRPVSATSFPRRDSPLIRLLFGQSFEHRGAEHSRLGPIREAHRAIVLRFDPARTLRTGHQGRFPGFCPEEGVEPGALGLRE